MSIRRTLCILLAVLFLVSLTAASASAWTSKKATTESVSTPKAVEITSGPEVTCGKGGCFVTAISGGCFSGDTDISKYLSTDISKKLKELYGSGGLV